MTTNAIARSDAAQDDLVMWKQQDEDLVRDTFAKNATDAEWRLFKHLANTYGLDPFAKQIWCVKYGNNAASIYASRDGYLAVAHRSGQFDGLETHAFYDDGYLIRAECKVWRKDMSRPIVVDVPLSEYTSNTNALWKTKPETMLKKVAESQALRKAFNISGMYDPDEINDIRSERVDTATGEILPRKQPTPSPAKKTKAWADMDSSERVDETLRVIELRQKELAGIGLKVANPPTFDPADLKGMQEYATSLKGAIAAAKNPATVVAPEPVADDTADVPDDDTAR